MQKVSKHLTPNSLKMVLNKINNKNLAIFLYHLKLVQQDILKKEIEDLGILKKWWKNFRRWRYYLY